MCCMLPCAERQLLTKSWMAFLRYYEYHRTDRTEHQRTSGTFLIAWIWPKVSGTASLSFVTVAHTHMHTHTQTIHTHACTQDLIRPKGTDPIQVTEAHQDQTEWVISNVIRGNCTEVLRAVCQDWNELTGHADTPAPCNYLKLKDSLHYLSRPCLNVNSKNGVILVRPSNGNKAMTG